MVKWPKYFFAPNLMKTWGHLAIAFIKTMLNFQVKKLTRKSLHGAKTIEKAVLPLKLQQRPQCGMPIVSNMAKIISRVVVCGHLMMSLKYF